MHIYIYRYIFMDSYQKKKVDNVMQRAYMKVITLGNDLGSAGGFRPRSRRKEIDI